MDILKYLLIVYIIFFLGCKTDNYCVKKNDTVNVINIVIGNIITSSAAFSPIPVSPDSVLYRKTQQKLLIDKKISKNHFNADDLSQIESIVGAKYTTGSESGKYDSLICESTLTPEMGDVIIEIVDIKKFNVIDSLLIAKQADALLHIAPPIYNSKNDRCNIAVVFVCGRLCGGVTLYDFIFQENSWKLNERIHLAQF